MNAPEADQFARPLHSIETLYSIMGGPGVVSVTCTSTPTAESITALWKDGRVGTYRGIKEGAVKYSATVFGDKGVSTSGIYGSASRSTASSRRTTSTSGMRALPPRSPSSSKAARSP